MMFPRGFRHGGLDGGRRPQTEPRRHQLHLRQRALAALRDRARPRAAGLQRHPRRPVGRQHLPPPRRRRALAAGNQYHEVPRAETAVVGQPPRGSCASRRDAPGSRHRRAPPLPWSRSRSPRRRHRTAATPAPPSRRPSRWRRRGGFREGASRSRSRRAGPRRGEVRRARDPPCPIVRLTLAVACQNTNQLVRAVSAYRDYLRETPREDDPAASTPPPGAEIPRRAWLRGASRSAATRCGRFDGVALTSRWSGRTSRSTRGPISSRWSAPRAIASGSTARSSSGDATVILIAALRRARPRTAAPGLASADAPSAGRSLRPGPDGRWSLAARATTTPISLWRQRFFPSPSPSSSGTARRRAWWRCRSGTAPQPWFAGGARGGGVRGVRALRRGLAHLRFASASASRSAPSRASASAARGHHRRAPLTTPATPRALRSVARRQLSVGAQRETARELAHAAGAGAALPHQPGRRAGDGRPRRASPTAPELDRGRRAWCTATPLTRSRL